MIYRNELYHYDIKGMRWGICRYQNPDGTLTDAGVKRYRGDVQKANYDLLRSRHPERIQENRSYKHAVGMASWLVTDKDFVKRQKDLDKVMDEKDLTKEQKKPRN